ncbi:MAG: hypothetical protein E6073_02315 [Anaerococcus vaginalis]|nr:hypothetical protein [Anaerococcus vaginalis]
MDGKNNTDIIKNLTKSELEVFAFLNKNSDRLLAMTIEEVAEKCFVSNATITRTAKKKKVFYHKINTKIIIN